IERYRISSIEPNLLKDEIIEFVSKSNKFLPHFHIPLQSGSNEILGKMKRRYRRELFAERVNQIKEIMPDAFIGVDVIVGFPGETDEKFQETYDFLNALEISFLHVFSYSIRPGTPAAEMEEQVDQQIIQLRSKQLHQLSEYKHRLFYQKNTDQEGTVLFEAKNEKGFMYGFTKNYLKVEVPFSEKRINCIENVILSNLTSKNTFKIKEA
ncbi:MAG: radical SAM protein, partial [Bacteroidales bacterium]|nr:radical SAM protein [Bacteroidales bacterium]